MHISHSHLTRLRSLLTALPRKATLEVLNHVHFTPQSDGHTVVIAASNLDNEFHWPLTLPEPHGLDSHLSCPISWFLNISRNIPKDGSLELTALDHAACALPSGTQFHSRCPESRQDIADFPGFETSGYTQGAWLGLDTLRAARSALPFASTDETRYVLNSVFIQTLGHIVATNGRFLAAGWTTGTSLPGDIILPPTALQLLLSAEPTAEERLPVWFIPGKKEYPNTTLLCRPFDTCLLKCHLIEGNYPNWRQVVPHSNNQKAFVTVTKTFRDFLLQHERSTKEEVTVTLELQADHLVSATCSANIKGAKSFLCPPTLVGSWKGDCAPFDIKFNVSLLIPCLDFSGPYLRLIDDISPMTGGQPNGRLTVLMPMRS